MNTSLAPGFLIASPPLGDPNFDRTVVLLAKHNEDGALGFVVNREAPLNLGELLEQAGYGHGREGTRLGVANEHAGASINDLTDPQAIDELSGNAAFCGVSVDVTLAP